MANESGLFIEGWDDFYKNFSKFVDKWDAEKEKLLKKMGTIYRAEIIPHVPVDTSHLVDSIKVYTGGISHDYVEVGTNVEYALYVNDGHVQHSRMLSVSSVTAGGKTKQVKLKERYIAGVYFMEKGWEDAKPRLKRLVNSFMEQCAREVEGGRL